MMPVMERARRYVARCPVAVSGNGGHNATFHVASLLVHGFALDEQVALELLREYNARCVPPWDDYQLRHKILSAAQASHTGPRGHLLSKGELRIAKGYGGRNQRSDVGGQMSQGGGQMSEVRGQRSEIGGLRSEVRIRPQFNPVLLKRVAAKAAAIADVSAFLAERSPVRVETQDSASLLRRLYPRGSGEKVLIFNNMESQGQLLWEADRSDAIQERHLPRGEDGVWFLPQPVSGKFLPNPRMDGKLSRRSEEAVTSWRYAVLESDKADCEDWLRCLVQMPVRIACVCESGGRSIHALVRVDAKSKADWDEQIREAKPVLVTLGADGGALSAVRLSRLPQAMRGEKQQRLLYLNPEPDGVPIWQQPVRGNIYPGERSE